MAGDLAGTIDTKNDITMTSRWSSGTTVTGQFVVGLTSRLMKRLLLLFIFLPVPLEASPITGAFTTGTMNSTTTTKANYS